MTGTTAVKSLSNVSSLTLDVVDHPVIIEVAGTGASTPPPATNHLYGGTGNDTFTVTNANQIVDESRGGGTDTVKASISFSLADQKHTVGTIENLTLTGTANLSATGNNTANILTGNDGNNSLNGGKGNDRLIGGLGNDKLIGKAGADVLTGGSGGDSFVFDVKPDNTSVDKIRDFSSAAGDKLMLDHSIFAELSLSGFSDENFVLGRNALEADDKLIYDQASGILSYDADGSAAGVAIHVADLDNSAALHFKDFMLI